MGENQRAEAHAHAHAAEGRKRGKTDNKLRNDERDIEHAVEVFFQLEIVSVSADGGQGAEHDGDER